MTSALLLLNTTAASEAMSQNRVWRSRSDLSRHQCKCTLGIVPESRCSLHPPNSLYDSLDARLVAVREERPGHPGVLIGSGDGGAVVAAPADARCEPPTPLVLHRVDPAERGSGARHEQCMPIAVAACADPEEPWLTSRRVFPRDHPSPGRKRAAVRALGRVTDGRQDGGGPVPGMVCRR
jgi:hypothetical protein